MEQRQPNMIWIIADQFRAQATGFMGDPNVHTPNLDRMAAEGIVFPNAVSGFPLCTPFRGSLFSGRYPHHCVPAHEGQLPPHLPTIATVFSEHGYDTAYFGKWHLDGYGAQGGRAAQHIVPPERRGGFQTWVAYENNNSQWDSWVHGGEGDAAFHCRLPGYETDALTDLFAAHLEAHARAEQPRPFFAVLSVQPPHEPYVAPEDFMRRHSAAAVQLRPNVPDIARITQKARRDLAGYYAMIENLDMNVGRVLAALQRSGLAHETHVLFFSDHGDMHGSHGCFHKTHPYEESLRVPFIIGGSSAQPLSRSGFPQAPINHVDIAPTTLGLCGIGAPEWMQGTDYSGYRVRSRQVENEPDSAYLQMITPVGYADYFDRPWRGVVTKQGWKYIALEGQPFLLVNLNEDPYEQNNLAFTGRYEKRRRDLQAQLRAWMARTGDEFALPGGDG